MKRAHPKPLWSFGWAGWALVTIAMLLIIAMAIGVDVRFWILEHIAAWFSVKALFWFVSLCLQSIAMFDFPILILNSGWSVPPTMRFSLITLCLGLIALQVHPQRTPAWRCLPIVLVGIILPILTLSAVAWLGPLFGPVTLANRFNTEQALLSWSVLSAILATLSLLLATRSVRQSLFAFLILAVGVWLTAEATRSDIASTKPPLLLRVYSSDQWYKWLGWAWNPAFLRV